MGKRKVWKMWCDFYKNKPCTVYDEKSYAIACLPEEEGWRVGRVVISELPSPTKEKRK